MGLFNFFSKSNSKKGDSEAIPGAESVVTCFNSDSSYSYKLYALEGNVYYKNQIIGTYVKNITEVEVKTRVSNVRCNFHHKEFQTNGKFYTSFFQLDIAYSNIPGLLSEHIEKSSTEVTTYTIESKVDESFATYTGDCAGALAAFVCAHSVLITDSIYHSVFTD